MKLGMSSWSYHKTIKSGKLDHKGWIKLCAGLGLDGVELLDIHFPTAENSYLSEIKNLCAENKLDIFCTSASNDFGLPIKRARNAMERMVRRWIERSVFLGSPILRVFAGWPGLKTKSLHLMEKFRLWDEMCGRLRELSTEAKEAGIVMAIENHNGRGFTKSCDDLFSILEAAPDLRVCLDTGDYIVTTAETNGYPAVERAACKSVHVHAKLYDLDEKGCDPSQDWSKILDILKQANFDGALAIEYEGKDDPLKALPRGVEYLSNIMRKKGLRS